MMRICPKTNFSFTNIPVTTPTRFGHGAQILVEADKGFLVIPDFKPPFKFTWNLGRNIIDLSGEAVANHEADIIVVLMKQ